MKYLATCRFDGRGKEYYWEMSKEIFEKARTLFENNLDVYAFLENRKGYALCKVIKLSCVKDDDKNYKHVIDVISKQNFYTQFYKIFNIEDTDKELGFGID